MIKLLDQKKGATISKYIYGQFAEHLGRCIYEGIYVGEESNIPNTNGIRNDVVEALKNIQVPVVRWPGGCFADEYHWKDGIGPKEKRKKMVNTHWGGITENNHFGTHEFFELIKQLGCEAYVNGNVGSGTVQEMSEWVEYITMDGISPMADLRKENGQEKAWEMKFFGVGNENWGCGGNMRPEYYADLYRRYHTYVRQYGDKKIYKVAGGANVADYHWTEVLMKNAHWLMDGLSLHYYVHPKGWEEKGSAIDFDQPEWFVTCQKAAYMEELIKKHAAIMDVYDPEKRVGLIIDEWGTWFSVEPGTNPGFLYQQNTVRDAMVAAITLNIFHKYADRIHMANIAQMVNVLQAMILTDSDKMIKTPTYHVFDLYKIHQEAAHVEMYGDLPKNMTMTASKKNNMLNLSLCNYNLDENQAITFDFESNWSKIISSRYLTGEKMNSYNDFDHPEDVIIQDFNDCQLENGKLTIMVPAKSVVTIQLGE
ncbi:intracellular exo-alpha-L-arabinofuranosidase 2 [Melissococcus plutonius]|uniref:alpha-N-arabinofuranosidase n=1 Tax=Melissococcus plutonius TaxID=33970 RepID=UPI00065DE9BB|nr:alpha-L-arabinofuranosidase C-terminal domain-containing protein [Melissococcus plutonius]AIM24362.1 intracellular exo-alpha-L-arabinofuranosidase 2 [Melissococcus plutonius S1]KMT25750.1 intracellular exo-alpha-L-arabinofuranosidase 2 [Melissococcus plutonius]KMT27095.1 intracellular exo-alpha-L-arabinofuranosidase 2 [Melissococcus plutonius]KMT28196.1 intracellular exo-alpha-L-arabinofuranosidase 2 [Melissococcus plutonius]KMT29933.1 intracellular exo-alpha-L-arabinofuranosidase 2 [Meliss